LPEQTKYDILIKDIEALETQVSILKHKYEDVHKRNKELEGLVAISEKESLTFQQKIANLQNELKKFQSESESNGINLLNLKERETLKAKMKDIISRIDYHLSSEVS
jgi:chromosome segregation ATPase